MINRNLIRTKIVQLTYAYYENGDNNIESAEKELFISISKAYDLYNYLLLLIVALTAEGRRHLDVEEIKAKREGKEAPNRKFVSNRFALQLEGNRQLNSFAEARGVNMAAFSAEIVRHLYRQITQSEIYRDYISNNTDSYEEDREFWRKIYRTQIEDNDELDALLEEKCLYWNDDKPTVDSFVVKTIKRFDQKNGRGQELLPDFDNEEDRDYARKLLRACILNADEYQRYIREVTRNWDISRMAFMDIVIMQIALAEMMTFPGIPVNVTINEYVELAKCYSTPQSGGYVNGMLDAAARYLIDSGRLAKTLNS